VCLLTIALASSGSAAPPGAVRKNGRLHIVTYNVAGLPEGLSNVNPVANLPLIGARLGKFDVALVQEDFAYPELLRQRLQLPYRSAAFVRGQALHFGDGLSLFSKVPLGEVKRRAWQACHGVFDSYSDCLTPKGLAFSRLEISPGLFVDVYDVHLDAGRAPGDVAARRAQLEQLVGTIRSWSAGHGLVLGGDFNLTSSELPTFRELLATVGVSDSCDVVRCKQASRLDRVLFRSGELVRLEPRSWRIAAFRDANGRALSDHEPVAVLFDWSTK
jgi:endonuclease/exonuclease/phosphatase family metal-dependent hydrolase